MQHKKKSKKKKHERAPLSPPDESLVAALLETVTESDPLELASRIPEPRLAAAVIERLPLGEASVPLLAALQEKFTDRAARKAIKRTLFKLKQKGIPAPDLTGDSSSAIRILQPVSSIEPVARVGLIGDMIGSRPVVVIIDRGVRGQDLGIGLVSDEEGISQFLFGSFSRKKVRELIDSIMEGAGPLVDTTLSHARTLLESAYSRHQERHPEMPTDYLELRPWLLDHADPLDHPIIFNHLPQSSLHEEDLTSAHVEKLLEHDFLKAWIVDFEQLKPFMEDMLKADGSPIVLTDAQKARRVQEIKEKSADALFPPEKRDFLKHRLEEMAYLFFTLDDEEMCTLSLHAARTMEQEDTLLRKNPVVTHLLERSLRLYMGDPQGEAPGKPLPAQTDSRIIVP